MVVMQVWDLEKYNSQGKDWTHMLGGAFQSTRAIKLFTPKFPEVEASTDDMSCCMLPNLAIVPIFSPTSIG